MRTLFVYICVFSLLYKGTLGGYHENTYHHHVPTHYYHHTGHAGVSDAHTDALGVALGFGAAVLAGLGLVAAAGQAIAGANAAAAIAGGCK